MNGHASPGYPVEMMSHEHATRVFQCMGSSTEIRWGERITVDLPVHLVPRGADALPGRLRNLSISGAFVETDASFPMRAPLTVALTVPPEGGVNLNLEAVVVRLEPGAIGIEWRDMACQPLMDLLHQPRRG
jgi:hypothetical protein